MSTFKTTLFLASVLLIAACNRQTASLSSATAPAAPTANADSKHFGAQISDDGAISYESLLERLQSSDSLEAKVKGTVEAVCQAKGCWMTIVSTGPDQPKMMVKFKDYGFFVPKNIAGRQVVMQGVAYREVTSVDELRHYAEDAGKSPEEIKAITQPKEELKFMASGVLLLD